MYIDLEDDLFGIKSNFTGMTLHNMYAAATGHQMANGLKSSIGQLGVEVFAFEFILIPNPNPNPNPNPHWRSLPLNSTLEKHFRAKWGISIQGF